MARSVDNVNFNAFIIYCSVLAKDGNSSFAFQVIIVHDQFTGVLVLTKYFCSMQDLVYQCGFTVVNVRYNGNVSDIH